jgi:hypothetical protein
MLKSLVNDVPGCIVKVNRDDPAVRSNNAIRIATDACESQGSKGIEFEWCVGADIEVNQPVMKTVGELEVFDVLNPFLLKTRVAVLKSINALTEKVHGPNTLRGIADACVVGDRLGNDSLF